MRIRHLLPLFWILFIFSIAVLNPQQVQAQVENISSGQERLETWQSEYVHLSAHGEITYQKDSLGNQIPDFSHVGYHFGDDPIPTIPVVARLQPNMSFFDTSGDASDDTDRIQALIDSVSLLPLNKDGFRGAILLEAGTYRVSGTLKIHSSGIILRGEGQGEEGTRILATGDTKRPLILIEGSGESEEVPGTRQKVTQQYVPVGQQFITVPHSERFRVGDEIMIHRPPSDQWIRDIGMDRITTSEIDRKIVQWDPETYQFYFERVITEIREDTLFFRNPMVMPLEEKYGGGNVYQHAFPGRIRHVGIENLRFTSEYKHEEDEDHAWDAVFMDKVEHSWVRNITAEFFGYSAVSIERNSKHITVLNSTNLSPKSVITGARRYSFNVDGQLNMVQGCKTLEGRHDFVTGSRVAGPNVFVDGIAQKPHNDIGPHQRWAMGTLYDNIITEGQLNVQNRDDRGSGHGWAGINHVVWNSQAKTAVIQSPEVSGTNYAIGLRALKTVGFSPDSPDGIWEGHNRSGLTPRSLYHAQLTARKKKERTQLLIQIQEVEKPRVLEDAEKFIEDTPVTITSFRSERSAGGPNDYYSEGTYWWPDSANPTGPYIRRDGETNPDNFDAHRLALERFSTITGTLTAAYLLTEDSRYTDAAMRHFHAWFVDPVTKMNPHLRYAQAIYGITEGRGIGIIDTGHLIDAVRSFVIISDRNLYTEDQLQPIRKWFAEYLDWLMTHPNGIEEMNWRNNHGSWWHVQAAILARATGNEQVLSQIRERFTSILLPNQIDEDGKFPFEISRTKPLAYSQYNLEAFILLALILLDENHDFLPLRSDYEPLYKAIQYLKPGLLDKSKWEFEPDVSEWDQQPNRFTFFPLLAYYENDSKWLETWANISVESRTMESLRNLSAKNILLWLPLLTEGFSEENYRPISDSESILSATSSKVEIPSLFENPILPGFNPDPSITKAGEDYYLTTSTFEYFPGLPIYKSRDLVNWELIGHAIHRTDQLVYGDVTNSRGIFAPSFKYRNGKFYLATRLIGTPEKKGSFIVTAEDPAGPWSDPIWLDEAGGIDPSLFFDEDGKAYLLGNLRPQDAEWQRHRIIWIQEYDFEKQKFVDEQRTLLDARNFVDGPLGEGGTRGVNNFEGPHLYKKDGFYYLVIAHGGTEEYHAVSIFRSRDIYGPYESNPDNPILTHRDLPYNHPITSTGHASLIQDPEHNWWIVYHGKRPYGQLTEPYETMSYPLGRETMLSPVDWSGAWPVVNQGGAMGRAERTHKTPMGVKAEQSSGFRDDFIDPKLDLRWNFIRIPIEPWYSIQDEALRINLRSEQITEVVNPSFIGTRMEQVNFTFTSAIEFDPQHDSEQAGMMLIREQHRFLALQMVQNEGQDFLEVQIKSSGESSIESIASHPVSETNLILKIEGRQNAYSFYYRFSAEEEWKTLASNVDGAFLGMDLGGGRFTGSYMGFYGSSNGNETTSTFSIDWTDIQFYKAPL